MSDLILAIDQGTTGTTALLINKQVQVVASHNVEFPNHYPKAGWVEHDIAEIWASVEAAVNGALKDLGSSDKVVAIGITNQRETSLFWDKNSGEPVHRALVWQDRRTTQRCNQLKEDGHEATITAKTGLVLDPYFSGTKAEWILDNVAGAREKATSGDLLFGTIDSWLAWKLCGAHATDPSNASRTLLFNIHTMDWDDSLLDLLNVPRECLPRICENSEVIGHSSGVGFIPDGIPVAGMAGDQQSALFGQACFTAGSAKCTFGTGSFLLMNTGNTPIQSDNGLLTTVGWRINGQTTYALEGSAFIAGAAVQWLRDGLGIIDSAPEIEALAKEVDSALGVSFVPALAGLGAPHWRPDARGILTGITGGTTKAHIARAVLDGIALQNCDMLDAMSCDLGAELTELKVDGGAASNNLLMQIQADLLGTTVVRPTVLETTALGCAFMAGLAVGMWESPEAVTNAWAEDWRFEPSMTQIQRDIELERWKAAVERA